MTNLGSILSAGWLLFGVWIPFSPEEALPETGVEESTHQATDRLIHRAELLAEDGEWDMAEQLLDEIEKRSQEEGYVLGTAISRLIRGDILLSRGRYEQSVDILRQAYEALSGYERELEAGNLLATAFRFTGNYSESLSLYTEMLDLARQMENHRFESGIQQNMAVVFKDLGDTSQAAEHYFNSLEIAETLADAPLKVIILNNIGELYREEEDFDRAQRYLTESLELSRQIGSKNDEGRSLLNLGIVRYRRGFYNEALQLYRQALDLSVELGDEHRPVQIYYNMGNVYLKQELYEEAEEAYLKSLALSHEVQSVQGEYYNNLGLGNVRLAHEEYEEALNRYLRALEIARLFNSGELKITVLENLREVYEKSGDFQKAYTYLKEQQQLSDSLAALDHDQALARYQTLFDLRSERQEKELLEDKLLAQRSAIFVTAFSLILVALAAVALLSLYRRQRSGLARLSKQNEELEELYTRVDMQKEELAQLNQTKDKLFSILAHDLRSPISQLQSLVYLIRHGAMKEVNLDEVLHQADQQLRNSIRTLENYLSWAQSQMEGLEPEIEPVDLHEKVEEVLTILRSDAGGKGIRIQNEVHPETIALADENMMRIILQNLISNAIKYSQPGGDVSIRSEEIGSDLRLSVSDNGVGIPEEVHERLFKAFEVSQEGTSNERGTGLGLSICREFASRQNGRIWFESLEGRGTVFYLEIPATELVS